MNKVKLLIIVIISLLILNIVALTFIFTRKSPMQGPTGEGPKQIIIDRLHFDESQQKKYSELVEDHRAKSRELNKNSRDLHNKLYELLKENLINKMEADSLILVIANNQKAIDNLNLDHFQKIKSICNTNQMELYNKLVDDLTHLFSPTPPKNNK